VRICFFNDIAVLGGGEIWVLNACRYLTSLNNRVSLVCPYRSPLHAAGQKEGIDLFKYVHMDGLPFYDPLYHFLKGREIDILYCTVIGAFCEAKVLERVVDRINRERPGSKMALVLKTGLPPMAGLTPEYYGVGAGNALRRLHVVSMHIKKTFLEWLPGICPDFIEVVYEGTDLERFRREGRYKKRDENRWGIPDNYRVVTCLARLHQMKGHDDLLLAIPEVLKVHPKTLFLIAGDGEERARLEHLGDYLNLDGAVRFIGHVEDVPSLLNITDILCHPSLNDGIPNSVVEAMATSLPVAASRVGGIPEVIEDHVSGLLMPPQDIHAITSTLQRLLADETLRVRLGRNARDKVKERFDLKKNTDRLVVLLEEELNELSSMPDTKIAHEENRFS